MPVFDGYVAVDWSANARPKSGRDSIWIAVCDTDGPPQCENPRTREAAMERIQTLLDEATAKGSPAALWIRLSVRVSRAHSSEANWLWWLGGRLGADCRSHPGLSQQWE